MGYMVTVHELKTLQIMRFGDWKERDVWNAHKLAAGYSRLPPQWFERAGHYIS